MRQTFNLYSGVQKCNLGSACFIAGYACRIFSRLKTLHQELRRRYVILFFWDSRCVIKLYYTAVFLDENVEVPSKPLLYTIGVSIRKKSLVSRDKVYFFTVTSSSIHKHSSFSLEAKNALGSDEHISLSSKKYSRYIYNTSYFPHIIRGMHPD